MTDGFGESRVKVEETQWKIKKIEDLFQVKTGTTPSTKESKYWKNASIIWITPSDLSKLNNEIQISNSERKINKIALDETNLSLLPEDSIIISTRAPVGYVSVIKERACFNQGCKGLIPRFPDKISSKFYCYYLRNRKNMLENRSSGSTFKELSKVELESFRVPYPPFVVQQKIAEILCQLDNSIRTLNEKIERAYVLKSGLLSKLVSEGISHKKFKSTEIGRIPADWDVVKLKDITENENDIVAGPFGSNLKVSDYREYGVPVIRLQNVDRNKFIEKDIVYISIEKSEELKYHSYMPGDILLAKLGIPIGKTCTVPLSMKPGIVVADVVRIRPSSKRAISPFIEYVLNSYMCSHQLKRETIGSTRPRVNISQVRNLLIPLPDKREQQKIAEILLTTDNMIKSNESRRLKLENIRKGVTHELFTKGEKVRGM